MSCSLCALPLSSGAHGRAYSPEIVVTQCLSGCDANRCHLACFERLELKCMKHAAKNMPMEDGLHAANGQLDQRAGKRLKEAMWDDTFSTVASLCVCSCGGFCRPVLESRGRVARVMRAADGTESKVVVHDADDGAGTSKSSGRQAEIEEAKAEEEAAALDKERAEKANARAAKLEAAAAARAAKAEKAAAKAKRGKERISGGAGEDGIGVGILAT